MNRHPRRNRRAGFTLMEILLVAAILVILASMGTVAYRTLGKGAYAKIATSEINAFVSACDAYYMDHQTFPSKLQDLYSAPQGGNTAQWAGPYMDRNRGDQFDPWGNEYRFTPDLANDRVVITSFGPDQAEGGGDDISNIQGNQG